MTFKLVFLPPQTATTRDWAKRLAGEVEAVRVAVPEILPEAEAAIGDAEAAFGTIPPEALRRAARLRWLQAPMAAPPAGYYYPELVAHPVVVTNMRGVYNDHIAAHILAFVLAFSRGLHRYIPNQARREWRSEGYSAQVVHLPEATALIVGVGGIGGETARLCAAFGVRVVGVDARREDVPEGVAELHRPEALDRLLPEADFVILTVPNTPQTTGFMDAARFRRMKNSAYFINIGRGATVKLADLVAALEQGQIAGAGLDVYEIEPLPPEHPLWTAPNVLLTPHMAGSGPYVQDRQFGVLLENARRFAAGQPLMNVVDKANWF
jgi:phosphoglycerate dehydrogenase-like enzyme